MAVMDALTGAGMHFHTWTNETFQEPHLAVLSGWHAARKTA